MSSQYDDFLAALDAAPSARRRDAVMRDYESDWLEGRPTWRDVFWMAVLLTLVVLAGSVAR